MSVSYLIRQRFAGFSLIDLQERPNQRDPLDQVENVDSVETLDFLSKIGKSRQGAGPAIVKSKFRGLCSGNRLKDARQIDNSAAGY